MKFHSAHTPTDIAASRRVFLQGAIGMLAASTSRSGLALPSRILRPSEKTIIVTFGGGARDEETFAQDGQENIPNLLQKLLPQGTFFTQVRNSGILGHYVATASVVTGVYERFNNFIAQPPPNPTIFEYFRRELKRPVTDAWVIAPSNGFQKIGGSSHHAFGPAYSAGVILPKRLLSSAMHGSVASPGDDMQHLLQDNYEMPEYQVNSSSQERELHVEMLESTLRVSVKDFVAHAKSLDSADELSLFIMRRLMDQQAPSMMMVTLHDMDVAHSGAYSLYVDAIRRADRLCGELWDAVQAHPEYKDRTTVYIMPDFGRDADDDPAGNGFQHHRTGSDMARTTWLLAMGHNIRQNVVVERPIESIDLVPTIGCRLGFSVGTPGTCIQELR